MRRNGILNVKLSRAISEMGHDDILLITDAGFPMAYDDRVIDLALCPGVPDLFTVLRAIRQEMWVEAYHMIADAKENNPVAWNGVAEIFPDALGGVKPNSWFHEEGYRGAKYIVRTGAWMPWGNVALISGIPVQEWFGNTGAPVPESWTERHALNVRHGKTGVE
ncbi:RbsD/FucU family protein [Paracoccaceae bacterium Fryx2]|nr:RbsD/FucU family protein [Paracoccaceae bacterium Fryx2]